MRENTLHSDQDGFGDLKSMFGDASLWPGPARGEEVAQLSARGQGVQGAVFLAEETGRKGSEEAVSGPARGLVWLEQSELVEIVPFLFKEIEALCFSRKFGFRANGIEIVLASEGLMFSSFTRLLEPPFLHL